MRAVLADTRVLIVAGVACAIEFVADKIPWVDSAWDSIHTFIRPIGAALLTSSLFSNLEPVYQVLLFLLAGGVALSGHSAKAATRLAVNHSPEPFSNVALSVAEDSFVAGGIYLLVMHPWVMAGIALAFLSLFAWLAPRIYRALRAEWTVFGALLRSWLGEVPELATYRRAGAVAQGAFLRPVPLIRRNCHCGHERSSERRGYALPDRPGSGVLLPVLGTCGGARDRPAAGPRNQEESFCSTNSSLVTKDGLRTRFDLLAGQLERARAEVERRSPSSPVG